MPGGRPTKLDQVVRVTNGALIFVDPPYLDDSRPRSLRGSSAYVMDNFDHEAFIRAMQTAEHASFAITHYPHPLYDEAGLRVAGDYTSHRNIPNGNGRDQQVERLYVLDRAQGHAPNESLFGGES